MSDFRARVRARIIGDFVADLAAIRADAGSPSFRSMAKRSGAISHATMHDAVQGTRLPSWETTVEFAKACGVEPDTLRGHWQEAARELSQLEHADPGMTPESGSSSGTGADAAGTDEGLGVAQTHAGEEGVRRSRRPIAMVGAAFVAGALVAGLTVKAIATGDDEQPVAKPSKPTPAQSAVLSTGKGSCIMNPPAHPAPPSDARTLIKLMQDITLQDCTDVARGKRTTKTWTFKNVGSQPLKGLRMKRIAPYRGPTLDCKMPEETPVKTINPGQTVAVSMPFEAATEPVDCFVRFMFIKPDGSYAFPYQQPIFVSVHVK